MPLYEYQCDACQRVHEVMQKFSDAPLAECPDCKGAVKKLMSMSSFSLKGSGWYTSDYKRAGGASSKSPDHSAEKPKEKAESCKPESGACSAPSTSA